MTCISPNTTITAAHCNEGAISVGGVKATQQLQHPFYKNGFIKNDFLVVVFDRQVCAATASILTREPTKGDKVTIAGFGKTDGCTSSSAVEEYLQGTNDVADTDPDNHETVLWGYGCNNPSETHPSLGLKPGEKAATQPGDSGGPLFIGGHVAGVLQGGDGWQGWKRRGLDGQIEVPAAWAGQPFFKYSSYNNLWAPEMRCHLAIVGANVPEANIPAIDVSDIFDTCKKMAETAYGQPLKPPAKGSGAPVVEPREAPEAACLPKVVAATTAFATKEAGGPIQHEGDFSFGLVGDVASYIIRYQVNAETRDYGVSFDVTTCKLTAGPRRN